MPKGSSKSTAVIQRLLEERRQYEAWIARLNNAADATPGHVRARVRADYEARLTAVIEELKAHGESAREAIDQKKQLRAELQKKEALAADKMTETELRHAVGEYDEAHWSQVHKDVLAELVSVREDLQAVEADIQKLEELDTLVGTQPVGAAPRGEAGGICWPPLTADVRRKLDGVNMGPHFLCWRSGFAQPRGPTMRMVLTCLVIAVLLLGVPCSSAHSPRINLLLRRRPGHTKACPSLCQSSPRSAKSARHWM